MVKRRKVGKKSKSIFSSQLLVGLVILIVAGYLYAENTGFSFKDFLGKDEPIPVINESLAVPVSSSGGGGGGGSTPPVQPEPEVVFDWCYQESPDIVNQTGIDGNCGLLYGGHVISGNESLWINYSNLNDGDWDTYAVAEEFAMPWAEISILYDKPPGALPNSLFQHKHDNFIGDINDPATVEFMEIPLSCWDFSPDYLVFTAVSRTNTSESAFKYSAFHCFNGTHYPTMTSLNMDAFIFEDAMWWAFPEGYMEEFEPIQ